MHVTLELPAKYRRKVITAILVKFGDTNSFYVFAVFVVSYATRELGYTRDATLLAIAAGALVCAVVIPLCGVLSDRSGRRPIFVTGLAGLILFAGPYFWLLGQRSTPLLFAATVLAMGVVWPPVTATLSALLAETFPAQVRYSGISFGYQIGGALVGGHCAADFDTAVICRPRTLALDCGFHRLDGGDFPRCCHLRKHRLCEPARDNKIGDTRTSLIRTGEAANLERSGAADE